MQFLHATHVQTFFNWSKSNGCNEAWDYSKFAKSVLAYSLCKHNIGKAAADSWKIILMNVLLLWFYCCKIKWIYEGPQKICFSFKGEYYYTLCLCLKANKSCDAIRGDCGSTGHCLMLCSSAGLIWESNQYLNIVQLWLFKDMFVL